MAPAVVDHRVGSPIRWTSWAHWRTAQRPPRPRRLIWVVEWVLSPFGTPVAAGYAGWPSWRHWRFGQRCPEHVWRRKHADGGLMQITPRQFGDGRVL